MAEVFHEVKNWMHRNAREVELCLWKVLFENGVAVDVADALLPYQNKDGGFGHALEADNWNPDSTPITTCTAIKYMRLAGFFDNEHPAYQGIIKFLRSGKYRRKDSWMFNVPENNNYPHAPWWTYSEEENAKEAAGVSACLSAFIIRVFPESDSLYDRAVKEAQLLLARLDEEFALGDMELEGLSELIGAITERELPNFDPKQLKQKLLEKSSKTICTDTARWKEYVKRPSSLITSPASPLYSEYQDIINKELDWTIENRGADGVWPITWQWYGMDNYNREFAISENWWKGMVAIERMQFLRNFGR